MHLLICFYVNSIYSRFQRLGAPFCGCPCNESPTIWGSVFEHLIVGNSHMGVSKTGEPFLGVVIVRIIVCCGLPCFWKLPYEPWSELLNRGVYRVLAKGLLGFLIRDHQRPCRAWKHWDSLLRKSTCAHQHDPRVQVTRHRRLEATVGT